MFFVFCFFFFQKIGFEISCKLQCQILFPEKSKKNNKIRNVFKGHIALDMDAPT